MIWLRSVRYLETEIQTLTTTPTVYIYTYVIRSYMARIQ